MTWWAAGTEVDGHSPVAGGSSGAAGSAMDRIATSVPEGATCVLILPDRGERYLDTVCSDAWVREHPGVVSHRWKAQC